MSFSVLMRLGPVQQYVPSSLALVGIQQYVSPTVSHVVDDDEQIGYSDDGQHAVPSALIVLALQQV